MSKRMSTIVGLVMVAFLLGLALPAAFADEALDKAFEALKTFEWGQDRNLVKPIDDAVVASHGDAAARKDLETRLVAELAGDAPRAAKDFACRKLSLIGTAQSVSALAGLLGNADLSHMSRYALERMPCDEAVAAMRGAMPKVSGKLKIGVINSLGVRRDAASTGALVGLLRDGDKQVAAAAAAALGAIGSPQAANALLPIQTTAPDACLVCAEQLLADGKKDDAKKIYTALAKADVPKHVRLAAMRGLLAVAGK